jgi:hypothetical protein
MFAGCYAGLFGTTANPVHHFDESGKEIRSFGGGMFVWPHGIHVDRDLTGSLTRAPRAPMTTRSFPRTTKGSAVIKFSPKKGSTTLKNPA